MLLPPYPGRDLPIGYHVRRGVRMHRRAQLAEARAVRAELERDAWRADWRVVLRDLLDMRRRVHNTETTLEEIAAQRPDALDRIIALGARFP